MNPYDPPQEIRRDGGRYLDSVLAALSVCGAIFAIYLVYHVTKEHYALIRDRGPSNLWDIVLTGVLWFSSAAGFGESARLWLTHRRRRAVTITVVSILVLLFAPRLAFGIIYGF